MNFDFKFTNLIGTVYCSGNVLFDPSGQRLLSPVGNRVTEYDLVENQTRTLQLAHRQDVSHICLCAKGQVLLSIDEDGRAILTNLRSVIPLHFFSFKSPVTSYSLTRDGDHFAVAFDNVIEIWSFQTLIGNATVDDPIFSPLKRTRVFTGHHDKIDSLTWSHDGRFLLSGSRDLSARIWSLTTEEDFTPTILSGHRSRLVLVWFSNSQEDIHSLSQDGALFSWQYGKESMDSSNDDRDSDNKLNWSITRRTFLSSPGVTIRCAAQSETRDLLAIGFSDGRFSLYESSSLNIIQSISISQNGFDTVCFNSTSEWIAFGTSHHGQLLVWEWQSETFVLKQQGHLDAITDLAWSPDGRTLVSSADDGRLKIWDIQSGNCVLTFTEHSSTVTACVFANKGGILFSASLDGSVRAWDLVRYRNFRTFSAPTRVAFTCIAVDPSGEIVCAGSSDSSHIYLWSVQTGQSLDQLMGHEGPVMALKFTPSGEYLVSGSWDHTVRAWSIFGRSQSSENLQMSAEVLDLACHPNSDQIAVSTLDGQITFWTLDSMKQDGGIDNRRDMSSGRKITDRRMAANVTGSNHATRIVYNADGSCLLAGGNSKYCCIYDVASGGLLKRITLSSNLAYSGVQEFLNSKNLTEDGNINGIKAGTKESSANAVSNNLPGAQLGLLANRDAKLCIRTAAASFSPLGSSFCVASPEGILLYSTGDSHRFDPFDLDVDVTPSTIVDALHDDDSLRALVLAFRLNEEGIIRRVFLAIPRTNILMVIKALPTAYISQMTKVLAFHANQSIHVEFLLMTVEAFLQYHGPYLKRNLLKFASELRSLEKSLLGLRSQISTMANHNLYQLKYVLSI